MKKKLEDPNPLFLSALYFNETRKNLAEVKPKPVSSKMSKKNRPHPYDMDKN